MPETTDSISIERIVSIWIIFGLIIGSSPVLSGIAFGSYEYDAGIDTDSTLSESIQQDHVREWRQSTRDDFEEGEVDDTLIIDDTGTMKLDTYSYKIGRVETPDSAWEGGYTTKSADPQYQASRGGFIDEFTMATGENVSSFDLMVLKPSGGDDYWVDTPQGETAIDNPQPGGRRTWDVDLPINQGDWIGIYAFGELSAAKTGGDHNYYRTGTNIGSTPETMNEVGQTKRHTMEAEIITHEENGVLESSVYDPGEYFWNWDTISWEYEEPTGTTDLTVETRTSPDQVSWSDWEEAENEEDVPSPRYRYIQYRVTFEATDGIDTPELEEISISYEVDEEPPQVTHEIVSGTMHDQGWYTDIVELNISAEDDISGVDSIYTRIGGAETWNEHETEAVTLEFDSGIHDIEYYAENNQGLESQIESLEIKVDNEAPELDITLPETTHQWYSFSPEVTISSEDDLSGLTRIDYRYDQNEEWETLFGNDINASYEDTIVCEERGEVYLEVRSIDLVGNEMVKNVTFYVDTATPTLQEISYSDTVWNNDMIVRADLRDQYSGIDDVRLYYDTGDGWRDVRMSQEGGEYVATIPGDHVGFSSSFEYYVEAVDNAGNVMETETEEASVGINAWYFTPTPVILVLLGLFVYWKKKREKEEELIPMKDSRLSKIKQGKEQKLEKIQEERYERFDWESADGRPPEGEMENGGFLPMTSEGSEPGDSGEWKEVCDMCGTHIASENLVACSCGNIYHEACVRFEGYCPNCGEDYANIEAAPSNKEEIPDAPDPFESTEEYDDVSMRQDQQQNGRQNPPERAPPMRQDQQQNDQRTPPERAPPMRQDQQQNDQRTPPERTPPMRQDQQQNDQRAPPERTPPMRQDQQQNDQRAPPERAPPMRQDQQQNDQRAPPERTVAQDRNDQPMRDENGKLLSPAAVAERRRRKSEGKSPQKGNDIRRDRRRDTGNREYSREEIPPPADDGVIKCPFCGSENEPEFEKCWACDANLDRDL